MQPDYTRPDHAELLAQMDIALSRYGLARIIDPVEVAGGTLNWNFRVETGQGPVFARRVRSGAAAEQVAREHALLRWVAERGIPVACALEDQQGHTVAQVDGALWTVSPWVEGRTPVRGATSAHEANLLGATHGRIQALLATHPASADTAAFVLPQLTRDELAARLLRIREAAIQRGLADAVIAAIDEQSELASQFFVDPGPRITASPLQFVHGDYHNQQVLVLEGQVAAVVDWEMARIQSRVHELVRSIAFSQLFADMQLIDAYLEGYGQRMRLTEAECREGVELWWLAQLRNTWAYEAFLFEANDRVQAFFPALISDLRRLADASWREDLADRMVRATCG
jgi:Ser/Thr protein kinase RdoA (MazF antagonist)